MQRLHGALAIACTFGTALVSTGAFAQTSPAREHLEVVVDGASTWPGRRFARADSLRSGATGRISSTAAHQILVELAADDTAPANLFDLNGRTLVFTPDGAGGYSRSVQSVAWEDDIGIPVADGAEIQLQSFTFDFAGRRWGSFFVSRQGLITFGEPLAYNYQDSDTRFTTMREIAVKLVDAPTISPLFKPTFGGAFGLDSLAGRHVAHRDDRAVVTWFAADQWGHYPGGLRPSTADNRYQAVLHADGRIAFNYRKITVSDGIVGLFDAAEVAKGHLLASIADPTDPELPGHLDLLDVSLYATNTDSSVILEFTLREPIPEPGAGEFYTYRLHLDTDEPYWDHPLDWSDEEATWGIYVREGGEYTARGKGVRQFLGGKGEARISLLADASVLEGDGRRISAMAVAVAAHFRDDQWVQGDYDSRVLLEFPAGGGTRGVDLSASDSRFSRDHAEIFHYRGPPNLTDISCRVLNALGDEFDLLTFHSEFRVDNQEAGSGWRPHWLNATGTGQQLRSAPCGSRRFRGHLHLPIWLPGIVVNDRDPGLTHEFMHTWTAYLSYEKNGRREPLSDTICGCHWRVGLHTPAAFPWRGGDAPSIMAALGGGFWRDNGDGTFTPAAAGRLFESGPSWLDLYLAGLASAAEVPDMFLLRNLQPVSEGDPWGPHTGDKEIITIEQIVAAEGPRIPSAAEAQKDFNAGFVYLLEPGQTPDPDLLRLHAEYRDKVIEHWSHVTGGRSRITTAVPGSPNSSPVAVGTLPDLTLRAGGAAVKVEAAAAFRDPDGGLLTFGATSSAPTVATVAVSRSVLTVTPQAAGTTTVTVTATDTGGLSAMRQFAVAVAAFPVISEGGVAPANGTPLVKRISPNALISVFGRDFAPQGAPTLSPALDASGRVAAVLAGACLEIGGRRAPLFAVTPTQINAQVPHDLTGEQATVTVVRGCGTENARRSEAANVAVAAVSPAFFNAVSNPDGRNPLAALHGGGPALVGAPELGAEFTPAAPGETVTLYGTGFGPTEPAIEAGRIPGAAANLVHPISFTVGGIAVPPQDVLYAGASPCCAGLQQFALRLPASLPDGDAAVTASVLGVYTPQGPFLTVQRR